MIGQAEDMPAEVGIDDHPELLTETRTSNPRYANHVGEDVVQIAQYGAFDHIVMGHHGTGRIGRAVLGSAAETVVRTTEHPATITDPATGS